MTKRQLNKIVGDCIHKIAAGYSGYVEELYKLVATRVFIEIFSIIKNRADSEDLLLEAMCKVIDKASQYVYDKNAVGWICTIARNLALDRYKYNRRHATVSLDLVDYHCYSTFDYDDTVDCLFSLLSEEEVALITLRFMKGFTYRQIADELGLKEPTVKYKVKAAKEKACEIAKNLTDPTI